MYFIHYFPFLIQYLFMQPTITTKDTFYSLILYYTKPN